MHQLNLPLSTHLTQASLQRWVTVLESASPAEQSVGLRLSAAHSLLHSRLFHSDQKATAGAVVGAGEGLAEKASAELVLVHLRASVVALTLLQVKLYAALLIFF